MKSNQKIFKTIRIISLLAVIILGLATIIGTGGGGGSSENDGDRVENSNGNTDDDGNGTDKGSDIDNGNGSDVIEVDFTNSLAMDFVYIESGTFMMGSPIDEIGREPWGIGDETQHQVTLTQSYYIQTTPVTQGQWGAVMGANPSYFSNCGDDCPVESISWNDIQEFITALNQQEGTTGYALPTEAQWEYAARAGSTTAFANGEITEIGSGYDPVLDSMGWYTYNSNNRTHPVALKDPNAWGLYDMHGNVWEWVADWYEEYPSSAVVDPTNPLGGMGLVLRSGSCDSKAQYCRSANREWATPEQKNKHFGFRLVLLSGH